MEVYFETMMGAIVFWRIKDDLQDHFVFCHHWFDEKWEEQHGRRRWTTGRIFQYCADSSGTILYLRAIQGHSGRNLIDPSSQDNVVIPSNGFFKYIYHVGCANQFTFHHQFRIDTGRTKFEQQTRQYFFLPVNPMDKEHKDPDTIDLGAPRLTQYMHTAWK